MALVPALQDRRRAIAGAVVKYQQPIEAALLLPEAAQLGVEEGCAVASGQHHLQLWGYHHCRPHLRK